MVEALDNSQTVDVSGVKSDSFDCLQGAQASAAAAGDAMADTINNRAHAPGEIDTSMAKQGMGQEAVDVSRLDQHFLKQPNLLLDLPFNEYRPIAGLRFVCKANSQREDQIIALSSSP